MVKEYIIGLMEIYIKENTKMIRQIIKEYIIMLMEINMKESSKMIR